jgi:hypothetical protein
MLNRYGLDEWSRNSLMSDDDRPVSDLYIPTVIENHDGDGTIFLMSRNAIYYVFPWLSECNRETHGGSDWFSWCLILDSVSEDDIVLTTLSVKAHKRLVRLCPACPAMLMSSMWNGVLTCVKSRVFTQSTCQSVWSPSATWMLYFFAIIETPTADLHWRQQVVLRLWFQKPKRGTILQRFQSKFVSGTNCQKRIVKNSR